TTADFLRRAAQGVDSAHSHLHQDQTNGFLLHVRSVASSFFGGPMPKSRVPGQRDNDRSTVGKVDSNFIPAYFHVRGLDIIDQSTHPSAPSEIPDSPQ